MIKKKNNKNNNTCRKETGQIKKYNGYIKSNYLRNNNCLFDSLRYKYFKKALK